MALFEECDEAGLHMDVFCFNALMGAVLKKDHAEKVLEVRRIEVCLPPQPPLACPRGSRQTRTVLRVVVRPAHVALDRLGRLGASFPFATNNQSKQRQHHQQPQQQQWQQHALKMLALGCRIAP